MKRFRISDSFKIGGGTHKEDRGHRIVLQALEVEVLSHSCHLGISCVELVSTQAAYDIELCDSPMFERALWCKVMFGSMNKKAQTYKKDSRHNMDMNGSRVRSILRKARSRSAWPTSSCTTVSKLFSLEGGSPSLSDVVLNMIEKTRV